MRGRKPLPTQLKLVQENPGKRPLPENEPKPTVQSGALPAHFAWLSKGAKEHWKRIAPELARVGLLTALDTSMLAIYCSAYDTWVRMSQVLEAEGMTYSSAGGLSRPRPEVAIARGAAEMMAKVGAEFGMSPASRTRVTAVLLPDPSADDW
jgi:P27 family predicted phage terminase small subunit